MNLTLGMVIDLKATIVDPAQIDNLDKAILCDNIYSRLVSFDDGTAKSWLAESYFVDKNSIHLTLGNNRTSSGLIITTADVEFSLKRLLVLDTNTHAKLDKFLSCSSKVSKITDKCESIQIIDNKRMILHSSSNNRANLLLHVLASTEYGIVPLSAVNTATLKITDYGNTTGAFYLDSRNNQTILKKNSHFSLANDFPDSIIIKELPNSQSVTEALLHGGIDIATTASNTSEADAFSLEASGKFNVFYTNQIKLFMVAFGKKFIESSSVGQRKHLTAEVRKVLLKQYPLSSGTEATDQFLSKTGDGRLSDAQKFKLDQIAPENFSKDTKIDFISYKGLEASTSDLETISHLNVHYSSDFPPEHPFENRPDSYFMSGDISFNVNYSLLSYYMTNQITAVEKEYAQSYLEKFLDAANESERLTLVNEFHFTILNRGLIGPLFVAPYTVVTRKPFSSHQTKLSASTKLWKISKNEH